MSVTGFNTSFLPEAMANTGFSAQVPANLQMTPTPAAPQSWYENPGFWSMIGKFGSALSPKDSWGDRLGQAAALEGQARQYGAGMNKMIGPMLAGETPGASPTQLSGALSSGGVSSAVPPTPGVAPGTYPGVGPVVNPVQQGVNPFNDVPFSGGPSTPVLSQAEMMGLSPDQIKDVMSTAVEAKKFPMEVERVKSGIEYTKSSTEHMKKLNEEIDRKKKIETDLDSAWDTTLSQWSNPESGAKPPKFIGEDAIPLLKSLGRVESAKIIDNMINLQKTSGRKLIMHWNDKTGRAYAADAETGMPVNTFEYEKNPEPSTEKLPPAGYVNFAYNRALSNSLPALEAHYVSTLGDKAKARAKMQQIQAMLGDDPNLTAGKIQNLIASAPAPLRAKIMADYNETLNSMVANQGQILPGGGAEKPQGPQTQGAGATPGILEYKKPVPKQNQFMLEGLPQGEPTPFDDLMSRYFDKEDMPMARIAMKRESSFNPKAYNVNKNGTADYGLFQINEVNVPELRKAGIINEVTDLYDADTNIVAASYLKKKYGWKPWKSSLGELAEGKTASMKVATGWKGAGYYMVDGKKTAIKSESEYKAMSGGK
jgi:hypothetical protein